MSSKQDHLRLVLPCPGQPTHPRDLTWTDAAIQRAHTPLGVACSVCGKAAEAIDMTPAGVCAECTANPAKAQARRDTLARWRKAAAKVLARKRKK